ncbi:MAG: RNA polymerase sigma factor [Brevinematia bacterium]
MDDKEFFNEVFESMKGNLTGYFLANKVPYHLVEELVNEVFILAWEYRSTLRDRSKVKSWIFSISKNVLRKVKNELKRRKNLFLDFDQVEYSYYVEGKEDNKEDMEYALKLIERLPEKYRDVFILFYVEEKSIEEISKLLGISENSCKVRLFRARNMISKFLGGQDER